MKTGRSLYATHNAVSSIIHYSSDSMKDLVHVFPPRSIWHTSGRIRRSLAVHLGGYAVNYKSIGHWQ